MKYKFKMDYGRTSTGEVSEGLGRPRSVSLFLRAGSTSTRIRTVQPEKHYYDERL